MREKCQSGQTLFDELHNFLHCKKKKKENSEKNKKSEAAALLSVDVFGPHCFALPLNVAGTQQKETVAERERERGKGRE